MINPCVQLPLISAEPGTGPSPKLVASLALQRAHGGAVAKLDEHYLDQAFPTTAHLAGTFDELTDPHRPGESGVGPLRWARCPAQGRLPLLAPAEVVVAATGGHPDALCRQALPTEGLTLTPLTNGSSGTVCMACAHGLPSDPGTRGTP